MSRKKAVYISDMQRAYIKHLSGTWLWRTEFPTWLLVVAIYSGWFCTVAWSQELGLFASTLLLIGFSTWFMSLQHELIHGHPTRNKFINKLLGILPLSLWYPYDVYSELHLQHHVDEDLTIPETDPESYYFTRKRWERFSALQRRLVRIRNTFPGRLILAPLLTMLWAITHIWQSFWNANLTSIVMWLIHFLLMVPVIAWLVHYDFSVSYYIFMVTGPMLSLTSVRSFLEHRAEEAPEARSVINEAGLFWRLLFLNLNYHSVHHDLPGIPWYGLPRVYRAHKAEYLQRNQGFYVAGYGELIRQHLVKPIKIEINPVFPDGRAERLELNRAEADESNHFTTDVQLP